MFAKEDRSNIEPAAEGDADAQATDAPEAKDSAAEGDAGAQAIDAPEAKDSAAEGDAGAQAIDAPEAKDSAAEGDADAQVTDTPEAKDSAAEGDAGAQAIDAPEAKDSAAEGDAGAQAIDAPEAKDSAAEGDAGAQAIDTPEAKDSAAEGDAGAQATDEPEAKDSTAEAVETVEDTEAEAEETGPPDDRNWYVVHCYSGYENKVKHNLEQRIETMQMQNQIFQVVVPTEDEIEVRDGKRRVVERRVFPGYILVQMVLTDDSWFVVRNTPGVTGFVGMGNEPTPLRPEEVQAIIRRMEAEAPKIKVTFKPGQKVRIIDGPFNEFIGVVGEIDMERAKVRVLVSFFGRETPVELDFLQVEKT